MAENDFGGVSIEETAKNAVRVFRKLKTCPHSCSWEHFESLEWLRDNLYSGSWKKMLTWLRTQQKQPSCYFATETRDNICKDIIIIERILK